MHALEPDRSTSEEAPATVEEANLPVNNSCLAVTYDVGIYAILKWRIYGRAWGTSDFSTPAKSTCDIAVFPLTQDRRELSAFRVHFLQPLAQRKAHFHATMPLRCSKYVPFHCIVSA